MNTVVIFITPTLGFEPAVDSLRSEAGRGRHTSQDLLVKMVGVEGFEPPRLSHSLPKRTRYQTTVYTPFLNWGAIRESNSAQRHHKSLCGRNTYSPI